MRPTRAPLPLCCILTGMLLVAACGQRTGNDSNAAQPTGLEPAAPALEGLSPEQIQQRAEAISPEQAEELGVMDTTVQVGDEP